jgi:hypothetical protein
MASDKTARQANRLINQGEITMQAHVYEANLSPSANAQSAAVTPAAATPSARTRWAGRVLSGLPALFLAFDGVIKVLNLQPVAEASQLLGLPVELAPGVGILLLACLTLYLLPRTAALGAVLLTGYLGGAISLQLRIGAPLFSLIFPVLLGVLLWGGLYLRDAQVRALLPLRR